MALWLVMPLRTISSMMGRTLAANRLALAFKAALPRFATSAMSGLPRRFPRRLAAARASLVRFEICSRSCSGFSPSAARPPQAAREAAPRDEGLLGLVLLPSSFAPCWDLSLECMHNSDFHLVNVFAL